MQKWVKLTQTHHFCVCKASLSISHIAQFLLIGKFCCFRPGKHISFTDDGRSIPWNIVSLNILVHDMINFFVLWTLNRQAKYFYALITIKNNIKLKIKIHIHKSTNDKMIPYLQWPVFLFLYHLLHPQ